VHLLTSFSFIDLNLLLLIPPFEVGSHKYFPSTVVFGTCRISITLLYSCSEHLESNIMEHLAGFTRCLVALSKDLVTLLLGPPWLERISGYHLQKGDVTLLGRVCKYDVPKAFVVALPSALT
jgi:hypothetical protein